MAEIVMWRYGASGGPMKMDQGLLQRRGCGGEKAAG